ncbi:glycosyltransferase [Cohnella sp. GCM10012308]|uniref:CgeB family protein n=1 Tax=Cohnella sp. GCM10012308 TaxID=3317329 RepID=UPI00361CBF6D
MPYKRGHRGRRIRRRMRSRSRLHVAAGRRQGWLEGWRLGACRRIADETPPPAARRRPWRVMYVPQGFDAIDQGVVAALGETTHLIVAPQAEMLSYAEIYRPDAVLVMNGLHTFPANQREQIEGIRNLGIKTAIWFVDDPYVSGDSAEIAPSYDFVFTHERSCVARYAELGCAQAYHLPLAADQELFKPMAVEEAYRTDICFIGVAFRNRVELFDSIAGFLKDKKVLIAGSHWDRLSHYGQLSKFVRSGWIEVPETVKYYNGAKIVINMHRTTEPLSDNKNTRHWEGHSINPRTFEIASCGTLQLTDLRPELPEYYRVGQEMASFSNPQELKEIIDYYLRNEEERLKVAARGYRRTRAEHTFVGRVKRLLDTIGLADPAEPPAGEGWTVG